MVFAQPPFDCRQRSPMASLPRQACLRAATPRAAPRAEVLHAVVEAAYVDVVLGAWGCGAFGNPPEAVAALFCEALGSGEFRGRFRTVVFAIIDPRGDGNLRPFEATWGQGAATGIRGINLGFQAERVCVACVLA